MKKLWQIIGLGIVMWGVNLVWPIANVALTPRVVDAIVVGLVVAVSAYFLGRQPFAENQAGGEIGSTPASRHPTRPSAPISFPFSRMPRSTRPLPDLVAPDLHSRITQPVPITAHNCSPR